MQEGELACYQAEHIRIRSRFPCGSSIDIIFEWIPLGENG
jgi:hypothetical protein